MTAPLGGKRRERKRLVRCGHRFAVITVDPANGDRVTRCGSCGGEGTMPLGVLQTMSRNLVSENVAALRRTIPPRIARKAADG